MGWDQLGALIGTLIAVVGVPLGYMASYHRRIASEVLRLRNDHEALERRVGYVERDYTTKEEWVREAAAMRKKLDEMCRIMVTMQSEAGLAVQFTRMTEAIAQLVTREQKDRHKEGTVRT